MGWQTTPPLEGGFDEIDCTQIDEMRRLIRGPKENGGLVWSPLPPVCGGLG